MVVFGLGLTTFVTGVLVRRFELRWFDDVCNVGRPLVARPGPVATAQVLRPHLACRIACLFGATRCQAETAVTFVARSLCVGETAITFARSKCVFLRHCGRAKVSLVSCVPVNERAKAVAVSFGREIVRPARSQHPKFGVFVLAGRVFRGRAAGGAVLGEFFRATEW